MSKGDSPYVTAFASGKVDMELDPSFQMKKYKAEEKETHDAPSVLPFELKDLPRYYAEVVDNGIRASKTIEDLIRAGQYENNKELVKLKRDTDKMIMHFMQTVDPTLDNFLIGDNLNYNGN